MKFKIRNHFPKYLLGIFNLDLGNKYLKKIVNGWRGVDENLSLWYSKLGSAR